MGHGRKEEEAGPKGGGCRAAKRRDMKPLGSQPEGITRKGAQKLDGEEGSARLRWELVRAAAAVGLQN
jgi:hypothetical protein